MARIRNQNGPEYRGELRAPIVRYASELEYFALDLDARDRRERGRIGSERLKKLALLLAHYGIKLDDPFRWDLLANYLATKHVPGLRITDNAPKKSGKPLANHNGLLIRLHEDIEKLLADPKIKTLGSACKKFRATLPNADRWKKLSHRTIENNYRNGKRLALRYKAEEEELKQMFAEVQGATPEVK